MKKKNLFCIPYAGGSSIIYNSWHKFLDINFELFPVELAGRGKRYKTVDERLWYRKVYNFFART